MEVITNFINSCGIQSWLYSNIQVVFLFIINYM